MISVKDWCPFHIFKCPYCQISNKTDHFSRVDKSTVMLTTTSNRQVGLLTGQDGEILNCTCLRCVFFEISISYLEMFRNAGSHFRKITIYYVCDTHKHATLSTSWYYLLTLLEGETKISLNLLFHHFTRSELITRRNEFTKIHVYA